VFGYVKPFIPRLMVCEYDNYRAVYCGVCKAMGRMGSPFARLTLSYDFVAVALMKNAALGKPLRTVPFRCKLNPFKKRSLAVNTEAQDYAARAALIMMYFKAVDDRQDKRGFFRLLTGLLLPTLRRNARKAAQAEPELYAVVEQYMSAQQTVEQRADVTVDMAADPSAAALGGIFASMDADAGQLLYDFGYMLGRWVYLIDAADDLYADRRSGGFNPLKQFDRQKAEAVLNLTVTEVSERFDRLPARLRHPILENIVSMGLPQQQKQVLREYDQPKKKKGTARGE